MFDIEVIKVKKVMFLSGYACKSWIWKHTQDKIKGVTPIALDWPSNLIDSFTTLNDYANWLNEQVTKVNCNTLIGHSMGGLVALKLANINSQIKKVVFVESFVKTPSKFFQNLMMNNVNKELQMQVVTMLKEEQALYNKQLVPKLKELDLSSTILDLNCELHAVYGNRGEQNFYGVENELNWQADLKNIIKLHIINNRCHFPMLENPLEMIEVLNEILIN